MENNKRIAKNTLFLYIRTMFTMLVALFTSRVVLNALGFVDYGLNNVVVGVITLFSFINNSLGAATSRFLTFELGTKNMEKLKTVFRTAFNIHFCMAIVVVVFCETAGLWIVNNVLTIPSERLFACNVIFQFVVISSFFSIMQVPFNAMIIAYERMDVFAGIGIANAFLQLGVAFLISITGFDRLIFYGGLNAVIVIIIYSFYHLYCKCRTIGYNLGKTMDKPLTKEMINFSGWSLFGGAVGMTRSTGINILVNIFFGPVVNAACAVTNQVNIALSSFYNNFTLSLNPQIVKSYASGEIIQMKKMIFRGGKFSFFLLMLFAIPIFLEADTVLHIWLKNVPDNATLFTKMIILFALTDCFTNTISMAIQATGKLKYYQLTVGGILLITFPITYICYKTGAAPVSAFIVMIITSIIAIVARLVFLKYYLDINIRDYFNNVLLVTFMVFLVSIIPPFFIHNIMDAGIIRLFTIICVTLCSSVLFVFTLGLTRMERQFTIVYVKRKILKR